MRVESHIYAAARELGLCLSERYSNCSLCQGKAKIKIRHEDGTVELIDCGICGESGESGDAMERTGYGDA